MTQTTDTPTISATRLFDVAREVTLRLGEWQFSRHLVASVSAHQVGGPSVFFTLSPSASDSDRLDFIDAFAAAHGMPVTAYPQGGGQLLAVSVREDLSPVSVSASVSVGGA